MMQIKTFIKNRLIGILCALAFLTFTPHAQAQYSQYQTLIGHSSSVTSVAFSPNGTTLASASSDHTIKIWMLRDGQWAQTQTLTEHTSCVYSVAFSPDGTTLASASYDRTIKIWMLQDGQWAQTQTLTGHTNSVNSVAFSPDGTTLASASSDRTIRIWMLQDGQWAQSQTLTGHIWNVTSVAFSPDGTTFASASSDRTIRIWINHPPVTRTKNAHSRIKTIEDDNQAKHEFEDEQPEYDEDLFGNTNLGKRTIKPKTPKVPKPKKQKTATQDDLDSVFTTCNLL